ncbi:hypothetical protein ABIC99_002455 [Sphaerotilus sulfidivorans]|uniref:Uncharacterized protein n=1 Tax=Sphaerotilus sulfidivorans TaxID=639200 RepID=A0ABV2INY4_9BURK
MLLKEGCPTSVTLANARAHAHPLATDGRGGGVGARLRGHDDVTG